MNLNAVSEESSDFHLDALLRLRFTDPRLQYTNGPACVLLPPGYALDNLWVPDAFFPQSRSVTIHTNFQKDSKFIKTRVCQDGQVQFSIRMSITMRCNMDYQKFPMDTQQCDIDLESYMYDSSQVYFKWENRGAYSWKPVQPVAFHPSDIGFGECKKTWMKYSCIAAKVTLKRISSHYVALIYVPTLFMVLLSCTIFWLPLHALLERTFLSVFLLLGTAILMAISQYATPQVGYMKAIDIWVVSCFMFLLIANLEIIVLFLLVRGSLGVGFQQFDASEGGESDSDKKSLVYVHPTIVRYLDLVLRLAYPAVFLLFLIVYFSMYHG